MSMLQWQKAPVPQTYPAVKSFQNLKRAGQTIGVAKKHYKKEHKTGIDDALQFVNGVVDRNWKTIIDVQRP